MSTENTANIIVTSHAELTVHIEKADQHSSPYAIIISSDGESLEKFRLKEGGTRINITPFLYRNCSIRIVNGKNTRVQKI